MKRLMTRVRDDYRRWLVRRGWTQEQVSEWERQHMKDAVPTCYACGQPLPREEAESA